MLSLQKRIEILEKDLLAEPPRISAYHDLPFAIMHYDPESEYDARKQINLFATRLTNAGKTAHFISVARILWEAIRETEGIEAICEEENQLGFSRAQETVSVILTDEAFKPLADELHRRTAGLDPETDVIIIVRVAAFAPALYRSAKLLDEMHGRTMVPMILCYPGNLEGESSLRFMNLPEREQTGAYNYRVKIY